MNDPNSSLTSVDNEVRMIVDYPRTRGARWENCPAEYATRAHSFVAAQLDTLNKRLAKLPNLRQGNLFQLPSFNLPIDASKVTV